MRAAAILLVTILCAGCATTGTVQIEKGEELLANSQKYLLSLDQVSYEKINLEEPVKSLSFFQLDNRLQPSTPFQGFTR